jgi:hypothetical protein
MTGRKEKPVYRSRRAFLENQQQVLPVATATAVEATTASTTMEAATAAPTMEATTASTTHVAATTKATTGVAPTAESAVEAATAASLRCECVWCPAAAVKPARSPHISAAIRRMSAVNSASTVNSSSAVDSASAVPTVCPATVPPAVSPAPAIPWPNAKEYAAIEPIRPVVAVRSARIRIVRVIAPLADRRAVDQRGGNDRGTYSYIPCVLSILGVLAILGVLGVCRCRKRNGQQRCNENQPNAPHKILLVPPQPA